MKFHQNVWDPENAHIFTGLRCMRHNGGKSVSDVNYFWLLVSCGLYKHFLVAWSILTSTDSVAGRQIGSISADDQMTVLLPLSLISTSIYILIYFFALDASQKMEVTLPSNLRTRLVCGPMLKHVSCLSPIESVQYLFRVGCDFDLGLNLRSFVDF